MSRPTSSATIEFPWGLIDASIKHHLEQHEWVEVHHEPNPETFIPVSTMDEVEVEVEGGILRLSNCNAYYGEFQELEEMLIEKGIPFDRTSSMDWNRDPGMRVFRPASTLESKAGPFGSETQAERPLDDFVVPAIDRWIGNLETGGLGMVREILKGKPEEAGEDIGVIAYRKTMEIMSYLEEVSLTYLPLADYVKEG